MDSKKTKKRQSVVISKNAIGILIKELFRQKVPSEIIVRENPRDIVHYHSYGGLSRFYEALTKRNLLGSACVNCKKIGIWLPPRVHCPDCWLEMIWRDIDPSE